MLTEDKIPTIEELWATAQEVNYICHRIGLNSAHDWTGIENVSDMILYLRSALKHLPQKSLDDRYTIRGPGEICLKSINFEKDLATLVEFEIEEPTRLGEVRELKRLLNKVKVAESVISEAIEDVEIGAHHHRAKALQILLEEFEEMRWLTSYESTGKVSFGYNEPDIDDILTAIKMRFDEEITIDISNLIKDFHVDPNTATVSWEWVK